MLNTSPLCLCVHVPLSPAFSLSPLMHMYICMYVCMHVCVCVCIYACMYVCTHMCVTVLSSLKEFLETYSTGFLYTFFTERVRESVSLTDTQYIGGAYRSCQIGPDFRTWRWPTARHMGGGLRCTGSRAPCKAWGRPGAWIHVVQAEANSYV